MVERDAEEAAVALRIGKVMTLVAMGLRHDNDGKCVGLVAVSDQLLSSTQSSTHLPFSKLARVGSSWVLGFSGDSSLLIPIRDELVAWEPDKKSSRELAEKATAIFKRYRTRSIEDIVLGPVGLDFATFISHGLSYLGPAKFNETYDTIRTWRLDLSLLLGGWKTGKPGFGHIFRISNPGTYDDSQLIGFDAIGSGSAIALGHLAACYDQHCESSDIAMSRLLEAKFMAEAQRNVGPETALAKMDTDGKTYDVDDRSIENYRKLWESRRKSTPTAWINTLISTECDDL